MPLANALRLELEATLVRRIPSAFTPAPRVVRRVEQVGIGAVDELLRGGVPLGAITEVVGPECSGRTSLALSFIASMAQAGKVCAWVDVSSTLHPESAAAAGVDLCRLLWVRCGVQQKTHVAANVSTSFALPRTYFTAPAIKKGLHGGGGGPHPRTETKGLSAAIGGLLTPGAISPRCAEPQQRINADKELFGPNPLPHATESRTSFSPGKPWSRMEQALRVTDLLLQAGGFGAIVLDMGSIAPEFVLRVPLATWFRYQKAAERSQVSILLLTQHACAKSSAGLVLRLQPGNALRNETTVFTGVEYHVEVLRERFTTSSNVIPLRKPPQRESGARWRSRTAWAASR